MYGLFLFILNLCSKSAKIPVQGKSKFAVTLKKYSFSYLAMEAYFSKKIGHGIQVSVIPFSLKLTL